MDADLIPPPAVKEDTDTVLQLLGRLMDMIGLMLTPDIKIHPVLFQGFVCHA